MTSTSKASRRLTVCDATTTSDRAQAVASACVALAYMIERGGEGYPERAYGIEYRR
jgi:hypothetical protein